MLLGSAVGLDIIEGMISMFDVDADALKILGAVNLLGSRIRRRSQSKVVDYACQQVQAPGLKEGFWDTSRICGASQP